MAKLLSDDQNVVSSIELIPSTQKNVDLPGDDKPQLWQLINLKLICGNFSLQLSDVESSLICRSPSDEIARLIDFLNKLIEHKMDRVIFEPHEPSFDITFERNSEGGIFVHAFIDASNSINDFYSGDAAGIRFYTNEKFIASFVKELEKDFHAL